MDRQRTDFIADLQNLYETYTDSVYAFTYRIDKHNTVSIKKDDLMFELSAIELSDLKNPIASIDSRIRKLTFVNSYLRIQSWAYDLTKEELIIAQQFIEKRMREHGK